MSAAIQLPEDYFELPGNKKKLRLNVRRADFEMIEKGLQNVIVVKPTHHYGSRIYNLRIGTIADYQLVEVFNGFNNYHSILVKYEGFFYAKSTHYLNFGGKVLEVNVGDIIVRLGEVVKVK